MNDELTIGPIEALYVDVSNSMPHVGSAAAEKLQGKLEAKRLFAFDNEVRAWGSEESSGGTSLACVLEHAGKLRYKRIAVLSDGRFPDFDQKLSEGITLIPVSSPSGSMYLLEVTIVEPKSHAQLGKW